MYRRFVFLALSVLLAYAPIDALAGQGSGSQSQNAHLRPHHAISPRHHARGSDDSRESYRSQRLRTNPNGAKLYTAGTRRRHFKRPRSEG